MYIYIYIYVCICIFIQPRAGFVCVPHGTLLLSECVGPKCTPAHGPLGEGSSMGDPRPALPGLGGSGRMGNRAGRCV